MIFKILKKSHMTEEFCTFVPDDPSCQNPTDGGNKPDDGMGPRPDGGEGKDMEGKMEDKEAAGMSA